MTILDWLSHGLLNLSPWGVVLAALILTHITIVSVTVYLHRYSAHRSLELHPALQHFFRCWLWLTTGMLTKEWTAIHRKHHALCETEEDPHSPVVKGIGEIFWKGAEAYSYASQDEAIMERYGRGCPDDWVERNVYTGRPFLGIILMLLIDVALFGALGITVWAVQMIWIPLFAAGVINGIGHFWGYRNFECPDAARNILPLGILIGGEELHNNHHTYPNSAKLSVKPFEFDIGWMWIRLFSMLGLAKVISTGPVVERVADKQDIDKDTAWALLNDRFSVMARYADEVVKPVFNAEYARADAATRKLMRRTRRLVVRQEALLSAKGKDRMAAALSRSAQMQMVYDFHRQLQDIWAKRGGNVDEVIADLKAWCQAAEQSGLEAMQEFAETLRSYATPAGVRAAT